MRISDWSSDVCSSDLVGLWAARSYERMAAIKDPGAIVIDEVVRPWLTLVPATLAPWAPTPWTVALPFCLFRPFAVVQTRPVRCAERRLPGASGVLAHALTPPPSTAALPSPRLSTPGPTRS